jgi:ketopantoate reductase
MSLKFLIAGAGAIGGYIGAQMARAGQDVVLFARGPHLRAMQERGLRVISLDGDFEVRPKARRMVCPGGIFNRARASFREYTWTASIRAA